MSGADGEDKSWESSRAKSPSSLAPRAVRAAATPSAWPRRARTSSRWTSAGRSIAWPTRWPPPTTWPRPSSRSRRSTGASSAAQADVRDEAQLRQAFDARRGRDRPGRHRARQRRHRPDGAATELHSAWQDVIDVNLTGVFNTVETAIPSMMERGAGRRDRVDQLHRRDQRHRRPDPRRPRLHGGQARRRRPDALLRQHPRPVTASG